MRVNNVKTILVVLYVSVFFLLGNQTLAEWGRTAHDYLDLPLGRGVSLCADGNGGCWATASSAVFFHIDRYGNFSWGGESFWILPEPGFNPEMALADNGDLIVAMDVPLHEEMSKVYVQRINLDREFIWGEEGIQLDNSRESQGVQGVYAGPIDNTYLVHWITSHNEDQRLQLINGDGNLLWGDHGIGRNFYYANSKINTTSDNCVIVARYADGDFMRITKINPGGELLWDLRFSPLDEYVGGIRLRGSESDRAGGCILVYKYEKHITIDDTLRRYFGVKAMRVSGDGDTLWTRLVYEFGGGQGNPGGSIQPIINYAGSGRFFVAWADPPRSFQVVALNVDGDLIWEEPIDIALNPGGYGRLEAVESDGGVCYTWSDGDRDIGVIPGHYGQRMNQHGERLWGESGRAIQATTNWQSTITTNGNGGVITVVYGGRNCLQMINRNGEIGVVLPVGVDEESDKQRPPEPSPKLNIYPNPGNSHFQIEFDSGFPNESYNYNIYNLMGRNLMSGVILKAPYLVNDLSRFSSGEYILRLQSSRSDVSARFMLVK